MQHLLVQANPGVAPLDIHIRRLAERQGQALVRSQQATLDDARALFTQLKAHLYFETFEVLSALMAQYFVAARQPPETIT
jgi:hypothetical protein